MHHKPQINDRLNTQNTTNPYAIYSRKVLVDGKEVLTDQEGYILNRTSGARALHAPRRNRRNWS